MYILPIPRACILLHLVIVIHADCESDIEDYFKGLNPSTPKLWALKMLDSSSKAPVDGILELNFLVQLGNYDQCLTIKGPNDPESNPRFKGQYCQFLLGFEGKQMEMLNEPIASAFQYQQNREQILNSGLSRAAEPIRTLFQWSVCAPSSCGPEEIKKIADFNLDFFMSAVNMQANSTMITNSCYFENDGSNTLSAASWAFLSLEAILIAWIIFSTAYDHWNPKLKISGWRILVDAFSLKRSVGDLVNLPKKAAPGQLNCIHGMRVLSTLWVILGHSYIFHQSWPLTNYVSSFQLIDSWAMAPILNGLVSVDTFFLMSGLLTAYVPLMDLKKGRKFSIPKYYIYRYLRITAPLAFLVFYLATVHYHVAHGPMWYMSAGHARATCQDYWWRTLLYISNYFASECIGQAWYLSVDMQLAFLAPLLLIPLMKWPKYGLGAILLLTLGSMAACFAITYVESYPWTLNLKIGANNTDFLMYFYRNALLRAVPYLVGMALGYVLANKRNIQIPKWGIYLGWILSAALCLSVLFTIMVFYASDYEYDRLDAAFYAGFHKLGWSLGVGWVIWACVNGFGGVANKILSWKYFLPLSKLSFSAYLVHQDFIHVYRALRRTAHVMSHFEALYFFCGNLLFIFPLALFLYLAVEAPAMTLLKTAFKKSASNQIEEKKH